MAKDQTRRHLLPASQGAVQADVSDVSSSIAAQKRYTEMPKGCKTMENLERTVFSFHVSPRLAQASEDLPTLLGSARPRTGDQKAGAGIVTKET